MSGGPCGVSQSTEEAGKGVKEQGDGEAVVSGRKHEGFRGHSWLVGRASPGLQINYSILETENGVTGSSQVTVGWEDPGSL